MVPISGYYLGVTPPTPSGYSQRPQSMSQASLPSSTPAHKNVASRQSLPALRHPTPPVTTPQRPINEEEGEEGEEDQPLPRKPSISEMRHKSSGTMDRNFKFPSPTQTQPPPVPPVPSTQSPAPKPELEAHGNEDNMTPPVVVVAPSSVEVPPPPPVEKEIRKSFVESEEGDEEVGETVEIDLR